jgi:7-cyano-7-deazaguanine synthase
MREILSEFLSFKFILLRAIRGSAYVYRFVPSWRIVYDVCIQRNQETHMAENGKAVVLVSGGLDSVCALHETAARKGVALGLSFDYGAKHNACELPFAAWQCARLGVPHRVVKLDFMNGLFQSDLLKSGGAIPDGHYEDATMRATVVPFRNGILLAIAAGVAESLGARAVVIAAHGGDHAIYPDCRETFMQPMAAAMAAGTYAGIELRRPFIGLTKAQIVQLGVQRGVDFAHTWSCYKGGDVHCGTCGTCVERREAFLLAGKSDPTVYADNSPLPAKPDTTGF